MGASVPAELPLASISLTNGVWFGGGALMKAVPAAGTGEERLLEGHSGEVGEEKDRRLLGTALGNGHMAPLQDLGLTAWSGHLTFHGQPCAGVLGR